jgi:hypothetical protein
MGGRPLMGEKTKPDMRRDDLVWVTADAWFAGGQRIRYDATSAHVLPDDAATRPGVLKVFERLQIQNFWPALIGGVIATTVSLVLHAALPDAKNHRSLTEEMA